MPLLYFLPVANLLNIHSISSSDTKWIIFYLGLSVLLGQFEQLMGAAYTCVARYAYGSFIKSMISLAAFAATMIPVVLGYGPRTAALVYRDRQQHRYSHLRPSSSVTICPGSSLDGSAHVSARFAASPLLHLPSWDSPLGTRSTYKER